MPKRTDIGKILIIGSGPIIIGQACEFDYSGTQACRALKEEGYSVVLINSNPATIMTDPDVADRTYIEPITVDVLEKIIEKERPDACLPTLGGQTGLNTAAEAYEKGIFNKYSVKLIGASYESIQKAENRKLFKASMAKIGIEVPASGFAYSVEEAHEIARQLGYPVIVRPSFTLGGFGSGVCFDNEELARVAKLGLKYSRIGEILIEESVLGWKEYELEVMRDKKDNVVIVCSIENMDPMGIHTGDSITVAPVQTLTDTEYQKMRRLAIDAIREIGVDTGGSNIQFAVNPDNGRMVIIEMNPRVSRSSALASKATGFPIAKIAAKLACGYTLDEIPNDITKETPAAFEPAIDYCVVKIPRFLFEKFPSADDTLGTQMQSVGEAMAIGRTFKEALQKGVRSIETGRSGLGCDGKDTIFGEKLENVSSLISWKTRLQSDDILRARILDYIAKPKPERVFYLKYAYYAGFTTEEIYKRTRIDPWFLDSILKIVTVEEDILSFREEAKTAPGGKLAGILRKAKECGFSDRQIAFLWDWDEMSVRRLRKRLGINAVFKLVDTCAAEFKAYTPYYYSTYERENESERSKKEKVIVLGSGANRIGQGIEFDYCCVQAVFALKEMGYEAIMVNSNPETVSTDYDISDKLYFESLTLEDVLNIYELEKPKGVIVQLGGQTPINLCNELSKHGVRILGTSVDSIDITEDRDRFKEFARKTGVEIPDSVSIMNAAGAKEVAQSIGYPVILRPSYVLGGRAMEIVYDNESLDHYLKEAVTVSERHPVLVEKFLEDAIEVDVDLIGDGRTYVIGAVMEHIEEAGVHSGDSAMVIPTFSLLDVVVEELREVSRKIARKLKIVGLANIQYAIMKGHVYCLEVNPRASRTIPFVSKSIGRPLANYATRVMLSNSLSATGYTKEIVPKNFSVKESVFPFVRLKGTDIILSPEMRSTGEVMGIDRDLAVAFYKSQLASYNKIPEVGKVFISVKDDDKTKIVDIARGFVDVGYTIIATAGTAAELRNNGLTVEVVRKMEEPEPNIMDLIRQGGVSIMINTPTGKGPMIAEARMRSFASSLNIICVTNVKAARATLSAVRMFKLKGMDVGALQDYQKELLPT